MSECKQSFSKEMNYNFQFSIFPKITFYPPWLILKLHNCDNPKAAKSDIEIESQSKFYYLSSHDFLQTTLETNKHENSFLKEINPNFEFSLEKNDTSPFMVNFETTQLS